MVVVDEAHRIKNPEGVWGRNAIEISKEAKAKVILPEHQCQMDMKTFIIYFNSFIHISLKKY